MQDQNLHGAMGDAAARAQELLNSLASAPLEEHPELFEEIHGALTQSLNDIDGL